VIMTNCVQCGAPRPVGNKKFCSKECRNEYRRVPKKIEITCKVCGFVFKVYPSRSNAKYCSYVCRDKCPEYLAKKSRLFVKNLIKCAQAQR